jgi:hypothetical protein
MKAWTGPGADGSQGYTAEEGMKAVIGGEGVDRMNRGEGRMSPQEMRKYIESAPGGRAENYSDAARQYALKLLRYIDKHDKFPKDPFALSKGMGLSGFQAGWARNAVCYARSEPTSPNPAIIKLR